MHLKGAPYIIKNNIQIDKLTSKKIIFDGNLKDAVKGFPQNINVAATLSLASRFEDIGVKNIEITLFLPSENFSEILDFMELYLKFQENIITEYAGSFEYRENLMKYFKKSNFIFRSLYESL